MGEATVGPPTGAGDSISVLSWTAGAQQLRRRLAFAAAHLGGEWPAVDDKNLIATLDGWLAPFLQRATGRADLAAVDVEMMLSTMLSWDQQTQLAQLVPSTLTTAAGRTVTIDYERDNPTVSVRVQDMFGTVVHPTITGDVPLTIELLSPGSADPDHQRPTGVLVGLVGNGAQGPAGRYPKHQWPIDPSIAEAKRLKDRPPE